MITIDVPILFLNGLKNEIVPASMMKTMYNLCEIDRKMLKIFTNGHHNDTVAESGYFDIIRAFVVKDILQEDVNNKKRKVFDIFKNET